MKITVNNKDYELKFSIHNLNKIDQVFSDGSKASQYGLGTIEAVQMLLTYDPIALNKIIFCVTDDDLTPEMIDDYLSNLTEKELEKLFENVVTELKKSPTISLHWRRLVGKTMSQTIIDFKKQLKEAQKELQSSTVTKHTEA